MYQYLKFLFLLVMMLAPACLEAAAFQLKENENGTWLGPHFRFLRSSEVDPAKILATKKGWFYKQNTVPSFGYTRDTFWAKIDLTSPHSEEETYYFVFNGPFEQVALYEGGQSPFTETVKGLFVRETEVNFRFPVFKIKLKPGLNTLLFTENVVAPHFPVRIFSEKEFESFRYKEHFFVAFIYGIALIPLLIALFMAVTLPKLSNLFYLLSYASSLLFSLFVTGAARPILSLLETSLTIELFPFEQFIFRNWIFWWGTFEFFSLCFGWFFLDLKKTASKKIKYLQYFGLFSSFSLAVFSYINPIPVINTFAMVYHVLAITNALISFSLYREGYHPAKNYAIAWASYAVILTFQLFYFFGLTGPSFISSWAILIGPLFQFFFFGLSIFNKQDFIERNLRRQNESTLRNLEATHKVLAGNFEKMRKQSEALGVFVSPTVQSEVLAGIDPLKYEPIEVRRIIAFADMRNYTAYAENHNPKTTYLTLNACFTCIMEPVFENYGEIDKTQGDAVMAVFKDTDSYRCLEAVLGARKRLSAQNRSRVASGLEPIKYGIGIAIGPVMSGNFGCAQKMDRSVVGDAANVASRIESKTKLYKVDILTTEEFIAEIIDYPYVRPIDSILLKGKSKPTTIFEIFGHNSPEIIEYKKSTSALLHAVLRLKADGNYESAIELLNEAIAQCPPHTYKQDTIMDETLLAIRERLKSTDSTAKEAA